METNIRYRIAVRINHTLWCVKVSWVKRKNHHVKD
jgi:hypothetical protein